MFRPAVPRAAFAMCEIGVFVLAFASSSTSSGSSTGRGNGSPLFEALNMGVRQANGTAGAECVYRRNSEGCSGDDVFFYFYALRYTGDGSKYSKRPIEYTSPAWLHSSGWDHSLPTVLIVHGYGGAAEDSLPGAVLRDAYLNTGQYNVFVADWGKLAALPCYVAAVLNMRPVAKCTAVMLTRLRTAGLNVDRLTCVGHSLGAHVCGITANYLPFRMHRIIGVDPAKPLIRNRPSGRLDAGDADVVQIIHATARYGDSKRMGHVDFCMNGARVQPFCRNVSNAELCGHARSVCYLAESLYRDEARRAEPCSRRCLESDGRDNGRPVINSFGQSPYVVIGQHTPDDVRGVYCVTNTDAPFCSRTNVRGSPHCCPPAVDNAAVPIEPFHTQDAVETQSEEDDDDGARH